MVERVRTEPEIFRSIADVHSLVLPKVVIVFADTALLMDILVTIFTKVRFVIKTVKNCLFIFADFTGLVFCRLHDSVDRYLAGHTVKKLDFAGVVDGVFMLVNAFLHLVVVSKVN
jgi:hypothetical protein